MSAGSLAGLIVTLFGAVAGGALAAVAAGLIPAGSQWELWTIFIVCFAGGVMLTLWFSAEPAVTLKLCGGYALLLALASGGLALGAALGAAPATGASSRATLWTLFVLCLPAGLVLMYSGGALAASRNSP